MPMEQQFMLSFRRILVKKKISICIRGISFLAILTILLLVLTNFLSSTELEDYQKRNSFLQNINAEDENSIDILFVGDSSIMASVIPMQIWDHEHITSYNLSYAMMEPQEAYYGIKYVLSKHSLKTVFIETQCFTTMNDNSLYLTNETNNLVDYCDKEIQGALDELYPVMKYKDELTSRKLGDLFYIHPSEIEDISKGYYYNKEVIPFKGKHGNESDGIASFKNGGDIFLKKIIKMCYDSSCRVVLTTMPQGLEWNTSLHRLVSDFAKDNNIYYIDFDTDLDSLLSNFSWNTDTRDGGGHLNYSGAKKVTLALEEFIASSLKLTPTKLNEFQINKWNSDKNLFYKKIA